jgi:16S rRNA (uracil1498-N3)-methyltransferase
MPKYFFAEGERKGGRVVLGGETAHHLLHVIRLAPGGKVVLCDGGGTDFSARLVSAQKGAAEFEIFAERSCATEPRMRIHLYAALLKGERMDWLVQKCVELGVAEITPVATRHTIVRIKDKAPSARIRKIAAAAASQSGRGVIPPVHGAVNFADALSAAVATGAPMVAAHEVERELCIRDVPLSGAENLSLWIGPEGGFSEDEAAALRGGGAHVVTLGARVLRAETAAVAAIAQILGIFEGGA